MTPFSQEEYQSRLEELFNKFPSVQNSGFSSGAYKAGLDGMRRFDAALGHPWKQYRCIHVAGTNGKGSVCSMLAAALSAQGFRVGLYTSPHILDFRERARVVEGGGFRLISEQEVWEFLESFSFEGLSFFEITTGMALWWFARQSVDYAVIEVGLGGLLDSTNIIEPELPVVTSIGLDHCALLGNTRAAIALQKAGIFKRGVPALVGERDSETSGVFGAFASDVGAQLHFADEFPLPEGIRLDSSSGDFQGQRSGSICLDLQGPCQGKNLRTALAALSLLGVAADFAALAKTAAITGFHGRWERLRKSPEVIADIGHNPPALRINFEALARADRPLYIVYGIMADKDLDSIAPLFPASARFYLCAPSTQRALPVEELQQRCLSLRPDISFEACPSVAAALSQAVADASSVADALVYVGGSTFVVSEAVRALESK